MHFKFKLYIYPHTVHVFYYPTMKESIEARNKYFKGTINNVEPDQAKFDALTVYNNKDVAILLSEKSTNDILSNIHHESIHVSTYTLNYCGVEISESNDEALTYLSTYIFKNIYKKLKL